MAVYLTVGELIKANWIKQATVGFEWSIDLSSAWVFESKRQRGENCEKAQLAPQHLSEWTHFVEHLILALV